MEFHPFLRAFSLGRSFNGLIQRRVRSASLYTAEVDAKKPQRSALLLLITALLPQL